MKKYIGIFGVLLALTASLTSCLKKSSVPALTGTEGSNNVIMFQDNGGPTGGSATSAVAGTGPFPLYSFRYNGLTNDTVGFDVLIYYGPLEAAPQDITVQLAVNASAVDSFNTINNTSYSVPDSSIYSFPKTVTIPKGQHLARVHVVITANEAFDFSQSYALPISIVSTNYGTISANYGTELDAFLIKNIFEAEYSVTGTFVDVSNSAFTAYYPQDVDLITTGAFSNFYYPLVLSSSPYPGYVFNADAAGDLSYYGSWGPEFIFDGEGNVTSVINEWGQPASNTRSAGLDPSGINKYTLSEDGSHVQTIDVSYFMFQSSLGYTAPSNPRVKITEHYVWEGGD